MGNASSKKSTVHETRLVLQNVLLEFQAGDSSSVAEVDRLCVRSSQLKTASAIHYSLFNLSRGTLDDPDGGYHCARTRDCNNRK